MSCRSVWKSKTKWWQKPRTPGRERGSRGSCRTGSGRVKSQLADYQQALDVQQTRAISITRRLLHLIVPKNCAICRTNRRQRRRMAGNLPGERAGSAEKMLSLEQKMSMAQTAHSQLSRLISWWWQSTAHWRVTRRGCRSRTIARRGRSASPGRAVQPLRMRLSELEQRLREQQELSVCWQISANVRARILISTNGSPASGTGSTHCLSFR